MYPTRPPAPRSSLPQPMPAGSAMPVSVGQNPWQELLSDTTVLPEQFFGPRMRLCTACPEAALMHAVLEDALACFQKQFVTEGRRIQRIVREAEAWLLSEDSHWPFSFVSVCAVLGLEPEAIRQRLQRWSHSHLMNTPQRKRQHVRGGRQSPRLAA
jgi:hypothetical protein